MANRRNYFYGQHVTGRTISSVGELNQGFDGLEAADQNLVADFGLVGYTQGGAVSQHAPTADLTVDVTAAKAYDQQGRRVQFPSTQTVTLATDSSSVSTAVVNSGNSKIVSLFARFKRANSDPRQDKNGDTQNFVQDESFEFFVVQGAEAVSPSPPALLTDGLLLADITRTFGQTQILNANILATRREDAFAISAGAISIHQGTPESTLQSLLTELNNHITGVSNKHPASAIDYAGSPNWRDTTSIAAGSVEAAIDAIVSRMAAFSGGSDGVSLIGAAPIVTGTITIAATSLRGQLDALADGTNIRYPGSGAWRDTTSIAAGSVKTTLDAIVTQLADNSSAGGTKKIGAAATTSIAAGSVFAQLDALDTLWGKYSRAATWTADHSWTAAAISFSASAVGGVLARDDNTTFGDSTVTNITLDQDEYRILVQTANHSATINAPTKKGRKVRLTKAQASAFTYDLLKTAGGVLIRFDSAAVGFVDLLSVDRGGLKWVISACGAWSGTQSSIDTTV